MLCFVQKGVKDVTVKSNALEQYLAMAAAAGLGNSQIVPSR